MGADNKMGISRELQNCVEKEIFPQYDSLGDPSHSSEHIRQVIANSFEIAKTQEVDLEMVYVVAAFHDIGMKKGRKDHEKHSREILEQDAVITAYFTDEECRIMGEAVEDHRASIGYEPRSIYGKIISEADRDIDFRRILLRTMQFSQKNFGIVDREKLLNEAYQHINEKYGRDSGLVFWLNYEKNVRQLQEVYDYLDDPVRFREVFEELLEEM